MLPFSVDDLETAVQHGQITRRPHPLYPYYIYNYSNMVQYAKQWGVVTENCRGLILDEDYNIVARPWRKFFNLGEVNLPIQFGDPVEVTDKMDGSLGIAYPTPHGEYFIATRGSFESDQARHATSIFHQKYGNPELFRAMRLSNMTYLFEIVFPENRIVLDYGKTDDLVLLGAVHNDTGYYYGPREAAAFIDWAGPVVRVMPYTTISDALVHMDRENAEGYVIRSHNFMVKLKQPDYVETHKLVTNASPLTVWEQLRQGKSRSEIVSVFPDEFHTYIESMIDPLLESFEMRLESIWAGYNKVNPSLSRKDFALGIRNSADKSYYFALRDGRSIKDALWKELRPTEPTILKG